MTGVFGAYSVVLALFRRINDPDAHGEEIDLSLYRSMHRILEFLVIEYDQLGAVRERSGNRSQYAVPSGVYRTRDDRWVSLASSTQSVFERLAQAMDERELIDDPEIPHQCGPRPQRRRYREDRDRMVRGE